MRQPPSACHLGGFGPGSSSELPEAHGREAVAPASSTGQHMPWLTLGCPRPQFPGL